MFRNRLWRRLNYQLCAERSRERAAPQHPHPQHPGYTRPDPLVTLPPGPATPARLSRVRCLLGQWPCTPGASSSQELPAAQGPALFGGAESSPEPCGCNGQAVHQASQLAEALGADTTSWERCTGSHSGSGGAHQSCAPQAGRSVTHRHGPRLPPPSSLPAPRRPGMQHSGPWVPFSPGLLSRRCPKLHIQPGLWFSSPWGQDWGEPGAPITCRLQSRRVRKPGRGGAALRRRLGSSARGANPVFCHIPPSALTSPQPCR